MGQKGFYRVNYPREDWNEFIKILDTNREVFSQADRAHLLNDAFSLAESGHLEYDIPMAMVAYLKKEEGLIPWETAYKSLEKIRRLLQGTKVYPLLRKVRMQKKPACKMHPFNIVWYSMTAFVSFF